MGGEYRVWTLSWYLSEDLSTSGGAKAREPLLDRGMHRIVRCAAVKVRYQTVVVGARR